MKLTIEFSSEEWKKLQELAAFRSKNARRKFSEEDCLKDFARHCVPGGTGTVSPEQAAKKYWDRKAKEKEEENKKGNNKA